MSGQRLLDDKSTFACPAKVLLAVALDHL